MMIKNYLLTALRYLRQHKSYAFINILGLALGFVCFLLLNFYVSSEQNYDRQHGHVFRLLQQVTDENGNVRETATNPPRPGLSAKEQFPEIEAVTQMMLFGRLTVGNDPGNRNYERVTTIDPSFFDVFRFKLIEGTAAGVFSQPNGIVLTKTLKERYFGSLPALNKTLKTNLFEGTVSGVMEDFPANTHLYAEIMVPSQTVAAAVGWWKEFMATNWHRNSLLTYMKLRPESDITALNGKITALVKEHTPKDAPFNSNFSLQPVEDIHLYGGTVEGEVNRGAGNAFYVRIFFWVALVILLVACFNYTGLLNVAFMGRSREIGVRKAIGAGRGNLLMQFFMESVLLTSMALFLALALLRIGQPLIAEWLGAPFDWSALPPERLAVLAAAGLGLSLLSIAYPALLTSRMKPAAALKDGGHTSGKTSLRQAMTVFQFAAAIAMTACTMVFYRQVNYMQTKERGFNLEGLLVIDINSGALRHNFEAIKHAFSQQPEVKNVSVSTRVPGEWKDFPLVSVHAQGRPASGAGEMIFVGADQDFLGTYHIRLLDGLNFSGIPSDTSQVLLTETAVRQLGLVHPVGQWVEIPSVNWSGDNHPLPQPARLQVSGVVADFQFEDFRQHLRPMVIGYRQNCIQNIDYYTLRVSTRDWNATLAALRRINDNFDPENPLEYHFLDEQFRRFVEADLLRSRLLMFFSGAVVFISCLGLFAMAAFVLRRRTKEIGVRKVLGAGVAGIVRLVSAEFLRLVLLGGIIAVPVAWLLMRRWLEEFAYRIDLQWWVFAAAAAVAVATALLTVGFQSVKAALANPVKALRNE